MDTRALTKKIRTKGVLLGQLYTKSGNLKEFTDPNANNLVAQVSVKSPVYYHADPSMSKGIKVLAIDVGMKNNQIRCFLNRGVDLKVVPVILYLTPPVGL